ncbi:HIT family protein [Candidatus Falkowbacteria bacterium]|jgi:histidine triad (HIT) family protein|nr:HIT family protein [Candidatus Falkowbacteria bacterium]
MPDCIFCKIINKETPSKIIYENDLVIAILDAFPSSLGHTLIIPKKHFVNIYDVEEEYLVEIIKVAKKLSLAYKEVWGIDNLQLIHNAGQDAQQKVFHFHLHLIPRKAGDGINLAHAQVDVSEEKKMAFWEKLRKANFS